LQCGYKQIGDVLSSYSVSVTISVLALPNAQKEKTLSKVSLPVKRLHISLIVYSIYFVLVPPAF